VTTLATDQLLTEIGRLIDCEVELVTRPSTAGPAFLVVPVERKHLRSVFWELVRADPCAGIWKSPEAALVGFSARCLDWAATARRQSPMDVERFVIEQLDCSGSAAAAQIQEAARKAGITGSALHRAATRLGVQRRKQGMRGGWMWVLETKTKAQSSTRGM
jgi:hypothetical protein